MKKYVPEKLIKISRYQNYFPTLPPDVQKDILSRMKELIIEEEQYCDKTMKNTNTTEINMDLLEKVTGGTIGSCDPAIGICDSTIGTCDPAIGKEELTEYPYDVVGSVEYPFKATGAF